MKSILVLLTFIIAFVSLLSMVTGYEVKRDINVLGFLQEPANNVQLAAQCARTFFQQCTSLGQSKQIVAVYVNPYELAFGIVSAFAIGSIVLGIAGFGTLAQYTAAAGIMVGISAWFLGIVNSYLGGVPFEIAVVLTGLINAILIYLMYDALKR